jgi:hypothetical protein
MGRAGSGRSTEDPNGAEIVGLAIQLGAFGRASLEARGKRPRRAPAPDHRRPGAAHFVVDAPCPSVDGLSGRNGRRPGVGANAELSERDPFVERHLDIVGDATRGAGAEWAPGTTAPLPAARRPDLPHLADLDDAVVAAKHAGHAIDAREVEAAVGHRLGRSGRSHSPLDRPPRQTPPLAPLPAAPGGEQCAERKKGPPPRQRRASFGLQAPLRSRRTA